LGIEIDSPIDINRRYHHSVYGYTKSAFELACTYGRLEIAKWLYNLGKQINYPINIYADNENALKYACENNKLEIAVWLCTLDNKYHINIDPTTNKIGHITN